MSTLTISNELSELLQTGRGFIHHQQWQQASKLCHHLTINYAQYADSWLLASQFALAVNDPEQAFTFITKALNIAPTHSQCQLQACQILIRQNQIIQANELADKLSQYSKNDDRLLTNIAHCLVSLERFDDAINCYQRAVSLKPDFAGYHYNLAATYRMMGQTESALNALANVLKYDPNDYEALQMRSSLKKQTRESNHIAELKSVLEQGVDSPHGKSHVLYALAKEHEDLALHTDSFNYLKQGADTKKDQLNYDVNRDIQILEDIQQNFDTQLISEKQNALAEQGQEAIFILGLPRTGSTLAERIISSHDDVFAAGELDNFKHLLLNQLSIKARNAHTRPNCLMAMSKHLDYRALGLNYLNSVKQWQGKHHKFIDKHPLNSNYVGFIHLALPKAKIIHIKRHPIDTCYAIYKNLFANAYPFSYCLDDLAKFYIAHHRLMKHWETVLPNVITSIHYEDIITDTTNTAKTIIAQCDLPWQTQCLDFHDNQLASKTASASQVREKVYASSVGKWQHFEAQLKPLIDRLTDAGIDC